MYVEVANPILNVCFWLHFMVILLLLLFSTALTCSDSVLNIFWQKICIFFKRMDKMDTHSKFKNIKAV